VIPGHKSHSKKLLLIGLPEYPIIADAQFLSRLLLSDPTLPEIYPRLEIRV
jgi:hypothetical protein